ncbi:MAG: hypothetical protein HYX68_09305 [Planctomycetes bacterium]|nr:hypothetical protein [Planctomycetota bacterium]
MRLGTAALTLAFGLGIVELVSAQESGNWFTRMFTPATKTSAAKKTEDEAAAKAAKKNAASASRLTKAKADLERRQAVCLKVREIALATGDDQLLKQAEQLDGRAWELYVAVKNRLVDSRRPIGEVRAKDLGLNKTSKKGER